MPSCAWPSCGFDRAASRRPNNFCSGLDGDVEAALPLAATHLERGESDLAVGVLTRALDEIDPTSVAAVPLWATLVDAHIAAGDHHGAEISLDRLMDCATRHPGFYVRATAAMARGRLCLAETTGDPCGCLREALSGFTKARAPMELAQAHFELARALAASNPRGRSPRRAPHSRASSVFPRLARQTPSAR